MKEFPPVSRRKTPTGRDKSVCLAVTPFVMAAGSTEKREKEASRLQPRALPFRVSSNCSLSAGFLVLCLPQRGRGTAKRWMRRASFRSASGMISLFVSRVSVHTRTEKQTRSPHPPPTVVPLPRWGRLTRNPTDKPKFECSVIVQPIVSQKGAPVNTKESLRSRSAARFCF